jgi:ribose transport system permease protein
MPSGLKKLLGITVLLTVVIVYTSIRAPNFLLPFNIQNQIRWTSLYSIISIGVAFVIITGGIDLSIGSVIGLMGCMLPLLLNEYHWSIWLALPAVLFFSALIGLIHGLLITKLHLQPFIVTLCGLLIYRGLARDITNDASQGYGTGYVTLKNLVKNTVIETITGHRPAFDLPNVFIFLVIIALIASFILNRTIWGRYLLALGRNEQAARFSGIRTDRIVIMTYVICSLLAGVAGILFSIDGNVAQPSNFGNFYELYAIAAAVLGGCSLRGGEGSIIGVIIGSALMRVLYNANTLLGGKSQREFEIIGGVILAAVIVDELIRLFETSRGTRQKRAQLAQATLAAKAP